jgi:predicted AlkP superfamily pyrophosphatase or phosphodiesterase
MVLMIHIDACRYDYINEEDAPFLFSRMQDHFSCRLVPTFGFEPDAAYLAGQYPDESDGGALFWYDPESAPVDPLWSRIPRLPLPADRLLRRAMTWVYGKRSDNPFFTTANIPFSIIDQFDVTRNQPIDAPGAIPSGLFDTLGERDKTWFTHVHPCHRVDLKSVLSRVQQHHPPVDLAFIHLGDLDRIGHRYGPGSPEQKHMMRKVDSGIRQIIHHYQNVDPHLDVVILGDHGMCAVTRHLDLASRLQSLDLTVKRDYLVFLDSTMARFWFFTDRARNRIQHLLSDIDDGIILDQNALDRYHLNYDHNRYGDLIFVAHAGVLLFPNYFQGHTPESGMHGYLPEVPQQQSVLILASSRGAPLETPNAVDMRRVYPTVLTLLGMDAHSFNVKGLI